MPQAVTTQSLTRAFEFVKAAQGARVGTGEGCCIHRGRIGAPADPRYGCVLRPVGLGWCPVVARQPTIISYCVAVRKKGSHRAYRSQKKSQRRMPFAKLSVVLTVFRLCQLSVREELMSERLLPLGMVSLRNPKSGRPLDEVAKTRSAVTIVSDRSGLRVGARFSDHAFSLGPSASAGRQAWMGANVPRITADARSNQCDTRKPGLVLVDTEQNRWDCTIRRRTPAGCGLGKTENPSP